MKITPYTISSLVEITRKILPPNATNIQIRDLCPLKLQGASSNMYSFVLTYACNGQDDKKELILRVFKRRFDSRCRSESLLLKELHDCNFRVPMLFHFEEDAQSLGNPFMLMENIKGDSVGSYLDRGLNVFELVEKMAQNLVTLHRIEPKNFSAFSELKINYAQRMQRLLNLRYLAYKFRNVPLFYFTSERRFARLAASLEKLHLNNYKPTLLHLDYEPNHVIISNGKLVTIDWGEALIGDPAFDLAWAYHKLRIGRDYAQTDLGEYFVKCYKRHLGNLPSNFEAYKRLVPLEMGVWAGISPFTGRKRSDYLKLIDLACGNLMGAYSSATYRKKLSHRMATHHTPVWRDIKYIENYALQFLEDQSIL